ncbi:cytochrome c-type biogenesis protein CcmF [Plautia stali symbiont]|nr:cytochrome c-type biogenesis protein CcmF [Plautia stali symbiont]
MLLLSTWTLAVAIFSRGMPQDALARVLAVTEKRGSFKSWTVLLAITAFSLSLLGTFLVIVIGSSLLLYALKGGQVRSRVQSEAWSRESFLLGNNVLLIAAMLVVLLGTLLPLVHKQLGLGSISVGESFFNTMFTWLMAPFALMLGIGPLVTLILSIVLPWLL